MNDSIAQRQTKDSRKGSIVLLIFAIFWGSFIGVFDVFIGRTLVGQIASRSFRPTPARINASEVSEHHGKGTTYGVRVEYTYSIDGKSYSSKRHTFSDSSSSDSAWAYEAVAAFPAGSQRTCYYDPRDPSRAVLSPGIHGSDLMMLLFLTPFNVIAGFLLCGVYWMWRDRRRPDGLTPRYVDRMHGREAYAVNKFNPAGAFFGMLLLATFLGIFVVAFSGGFHPSLAKVLSVWGVTIALSTTAALNVYLKTKAGRYDVVVDFSSRSLTAPAMYKRQRPETIPFSNIQKIELMSERTGSGDQSRTTWKVNLHTNHAQQIQLLETMVEDDARRFAETLQTKVQLTS